MCGIFIDFIDKCHARNITFLQQEWDTFLKVDQELWLTGILFLTYTLIWRGSLEERLLISDNGPWQLAIPTIIKIIRARKYTSIQYFTRTTWCILFKSILVWKVLNRHLRQVKIMILFKFISHFLEFFNNGLNWICRIQFFYCNLLITERTKLFVCQVFLNTCFTKGMSTRRWSSVWKIE